MQLPDDPHLLANAAAKHSSTVAQWIERLWTALIGGAGVSAWQSFQSRRMNRASSKKVEAEAEVTTEGSQREYIRTLLAEREALLARHDHEVAALQSRLDSVNALLAQLKTAGTTARVLIERHEVEVEKKTGGSV